jgi:hypothetical protein
MMDDVRPRDLDRIAIATAVIGAGSAVSLATYFVAGGPFGTINDLGNATTGILSACLAWRLRGLLTGRARDLAVAAALAGAAITVLGTSLVVSRTTTFLLAGLVSSVGFAGIGTWLVVVNRRASASTAWPRRLRALGIGAGSIMASGVLVAPGIALRLDDMATAPSWIWIGFLGWLGTFVAYPAWALWVAIVENRFARSVGVARETAVMN